MEITPTAATAEVMALLAASELPVDDLHDPTVMLFAMNDGDWVVGVVGLQLLDGAGLLRSLAVAPEARKRGLGDHLCNAIVREARARGFAELWLLTTSARDYFARRGFEPVARDQAPSAVRSTAQFTTLCPSSAAVMRRPI